jgi:hypothetical protein
MTKNWDALTQTEKIEDLRREVLDLITQDAKNKQRYGQKLVTG